MPTGTPVEVGTISKEKPTGYLRIKTEQGWKRLHRVLMEEKLGRKLRTDEQVDHINGNKEDNRPENLQVLSNTDHQLKGYENGELGIVSINIRRTIARREWAEKNKKLCIGCGREMNFNEKKYYTFGRKAFIKLKKCSYGCKKKAENMGHPVAYSSFA